MRLCVCARVCLLTCVRARLCVQLVCVICAHRPLTLSPLLSQVCDCQQPFARQEEGEQMPLPCMAGRLGAEVTRSLLEMEATFGRSLQILQHVRKGILKNTSWHDDNSRIIVTLSADELGLFREHICFLDKTIQPGLSKMLWFSKGASNFFINDCRLHASKGPGI
uniref:Uncharacterized protein n=1 Tax=Hucho hucho TaxID=62062 RepID=A0A4W5PN07_9TELE